MLVPASTFGVKKRAILVALALKMPVRMADERVLVIEVEQADFA